MTDDIVAKLERRLGRLHARQRLGIEGDHEARVFGHGLNFFHIENWYSVHSLIRKTLKASGLYWRGAANARRVQVRRNEVALGGLPTGFDGFTILHISDMHVDISPGAMETLESLLPGLRYDLCVLTGDFRGQTYGPFDDTLAGLERIRARIASPVYAVLGNHDTVRMLPGMEEMGIRLLLNESVVLEREGQRIHLAGIDDAHYFRVDNIEKTAERIPHDEVSILLSHTPEIYRQAAHAGFRLLLGGHTHGGQICLPGAIPITLDSHLPRRLGSGAWKYRGMAGYTSVGVGSSIVAVRLNCLPEITLHRLRSAPQ
ncbi:MAG: metallophosphoesterase [Alphaproteobacteria bacterium]|nr:metallophosphoesterase [Alphaproteobacteria bacterium]